MFQLLDFPDEILCKIFEYLSPFDALYSFLNLNSRLNRLLFPFKQQIDLTHLSYEQFLYYIQIILPIINKQEYLYAIKLGNKQTPGQIKLFNTFINERNIHQYLINIDTVFIEHPHIDELNEFIDKIRLYLSRLSRLSIEINHTRDDEFQRLTKLILNSILSIPNLIKLRIDMPSGLVLSRLPNSDIFNSLIDLTLNISLPTDLLILIQRIPNIKILSICISWWTSADRTLVKILDEMRLNNNNQTSILNSLKKFHLTINSILSFQFEHLEQILCKILNQHLTTNFTFILRNCVDHNNSLISLIDGKQWESLLSKFLCLKKFDLFIRMSGISMTDDEKIKINSFKSNYFIKKKWSFSYLKTLTRDAILFYSIPYRNNELFYILLENSHEIFHQFPINYATNLLIEQKNNHENEFNSSILYYFPFIQQLNLINVNFNPSIINPINIRSLHTLKIKNQQKINLSNLLQLLPLINTLYISYYSIENPYKSLENIPLPRIIYLSITDIPAYNIEELLFLLIRFPNLQCLHLHISNRRITDDELLRNLNEIIGKFHLLVYLKLQLEKDFDSLINWQQELNGRGKMFLTENIFDGILIHIWF